MYAVNPRNGGNPLHNLTVRVAVEENSISPGSSGRFFDNREPSAHGKAPHTQTQNSFVSQRGGKAGASLSCGPQHGL